MGIHINNEDKFAVEIKLPDGMAAKVDLPAAVNTKGVFDGQIAVPADRIGSRWVLDDAISGSRMLVVR